MTVDLVQSQVTVPDGQVFAFTLDPLRRAMLLAGTDELGLTLGRMDKVAAWQRADATRRPWAIPDDGKDSVLCRDRHKNESLP